MGSLFVPRGFQEPPKDDFAPIQDERPRDLMKWIRTDYNSARTKFKFIIFSMRDGAIMRYGIGPKVPDFRWTELKSKPSEVSFEKAETKTHLFCRVLRNSVPESHEYSKIRISRGV